MDNRPKVSVLVPICNVEKYLPKCLDSLIAQSLSDIEIICINDGSKDSSLEIITKYANRDSRIEIIDKINTGYGDSMNKGLEMARGEYIGIVESDDFVDKNMFKDMYELACKKNAEIVRSRYFLYWNKKKCVVAANKYFGKYNEIFCPIEVPEIFLMEPAIWSAIYKKSFIDRYEIKFLATPGASYQDTSFFIKTLFMAKSMYFVDKAYLFYRQDNMSSSVKQCNLDKTKFVHKEFKELDRYLTNFPKDYDVIKRYYNIKKFKAFYWNLTRINTMNITQYAKFINNDMDYGLLNNEIIEKYLSAKERLALYNLKNHNYYILYILFRLRDILRR